MQAYVEQCSDMKSREMGIIINAIDLYNQIDISSIYSKSNMSARETLVGVYLTANDNHFSNLFDSLRIFYLHHHFISRGPITFNTKIDRLLPKICYEAGKIFKFCINKKKIVLN